MRDVVLKENGKVQGSLTVEAALICPLICLVLCGMIQLTIGLYEKIEIYSEMIEERVEQRISSAELIRIEAVAAELFREVE